MENSKVKNYSYQINLVPELEGGYTVIIPALPGCVSFGETVEQATQNAKQAIELHLENLVVHHQAVPRESVEKPVFSTFVHIQKPTYA